ncbi:Py52 [Plasmodium yoelii yoelii]|uniref:Sporozoite surface protein P36p n=4 Tax=Plasmodium yoelii TaxID=5861 RepID=PF36P_PLAYO|nr:RecName: Full=Sporozoite surface protein P36p; AltName: Full=Sporozoite surface protein P52; Flags: Precursor [Plasmodium yoelii yoelii]AAK56487.1 Py36p protein [Plasmodium yoelii yoelii]AAK91678.1 Py52 [Plasmodium yoelii]EAA20643.1 Py52 [Plasmodium yoelii yoelii]
MKRRSIFMYYCFCFLLKYVAFSNVPNPNTTIGHFEICEVNTSSGDAEECVLENEFGKMFLFICDIDYNEMSKNIVLPSECAKKTYIDHVNPNGTSPEVNTYDIFPDLIAANESQFRDKFYFYGTPYSSKDIDFICLCFSETKPDIKHVMKMSFKKMTKKIKGCDFGDNIPTKKDLTNGKALYENSSCHIYAYPGDVIGINCYKKDINNIYNNNLELQPNNCFHNVYYEDDILLSSKNLIPNSRVIPDPSNDVKLSKMHSYMSYIILPDEINENVKISCACKRDEYIGTMFLYVNTSKNILTSPDNNVEEIAPLNDHYISIGDMWDMGLHENPEQIQGIISNHANKKYYEHMKIYKSNKMDSSDDDESNETESSENESNERTHNGNRANKDANNSEKMTGNRRKKNNSINNTNYYSNYEDDNGINISTHDKYYEDQHFGNNGPLRKKRTFWQNMFGTSSSYYEVFNYFSIAFILIIHMLLL